MPIIEPSTVVRAPRERVFDLARSIDAHQDSTCGTEERAVAGVTNGLIGQDDEVTWEARHVGLCHRLTVRITAFDRPNHFPDTMIAGPFRRLSHDHGVADHPAGTWRRDRFEFTALLGILGGMVDWLCRTGYLRRFLTWRNEVLKHWAETPEGDRYLGQVRPGNPPSAAEELKRDSRIRRQEFPLSVHEPTTNQGNKTMNTSLNIYTAYFLVSLGMTIWVARTLHKNGRLFLVDAFTGNRELADSVNHLLLVGFYLINLGFILLFLRVGSKPADLVEGVEYISTKLGIVILVLGAMHFFNMYHFARMRRKAHVSRIPPVPAAKI